MRPNASSAAVDKRPLKPAAAGPELGLTASGIAVSAVVAAARGCCWGNEGRTAAVRLSGMAAEGIPATTRSWSLLEHDEYDEYRRQMGQIGTSAAAGYDAQYTCSRSDQTLAAAGCKRLTSNGCRLRTCGRRGTCSAFGSLGHRFWKLQLIPCFQLAGAGHCCCGSLLSGCCL